MQLEDRVKGMAEIAANMQKQITRLEERLEELEGNISVVLNALVEIAKLRKEDG